MWSVSQIKCWYYIRHADKHISVLYHQMTLPLNLYFSHYQLHLRMSHPSLQLRKTELVSIEICLDSSLGVHTITTITRHEARGMSIISFHVNAAFKYRITHFIHIGTSDTNTTCNQFGHTQSTFGQITTVFQLSISDSCKYNWKKIQSNSSQAILDTAQ